MLALDADRKLLVASVPAVAEARIAVLPDENDESEEHEDPLSAGRGLVHGLMLGLACLAVVGGVLWLVL
jgi:hypothetical protein